MNEIEVLEVLTEILCDVLDRDGITLEMGTRASDVEGWGSLEFIRFVMAVERRFGRKFSTTEVASLRKVGDFVALIQRHAAG